MTGHSKRANIQGEKSPPLGRREFPVTEDEHGSRLDTFLRCQLGLPRLTALKAVRKGWVRVNGRRSQPGRRLAAGERVKITNYKLPLPGVDESGPGASGIARPPDSLIEAARASIRYCDADVIVSNKLSGAVVHRGSGHDHGWIDALAWAMGSVPARKRSGAERAGRDRQKRNLPTPVGRLDRDTSGLLVLARGRFAARRLFEQLRDGRLARNYIALVAGDLAGDDDVTNDGVIDAPLAKSGPPGRARMRVGPGGRQARTRFRVLRRLHGRATLLALELDTGRTHQIRAHLESIGNPLLGDRRYSTEKSRQTSREFGVTRLLLHAERVEFDHPRTGERVRAVAELPPEIARILDA